MLRETDALPPLCVRHQSLQVLFVFCPAYGVRLAEFSDSRPFFMGQKMAFIAGGVFYLAFSGDLEPFGRAFFGF
jgi:hypothetical protein